MNDPPKTNRGWRIVRRILIALAVLTTLIAIFYTEEDWRGKRAWENYQREMEARGENFDWQAYVPPTVPDDQNFFTSPVFSTNGYMTIGGNPTYSGPSAYWGFAKATDLKSWQTYYRSLTNEFPVAPQPQTPAADVLLALSKYDSVIEQWRQASQRSYFNVPMNYDNAFGRGLSPLLTDFAALKRCCQVLQLRATAELADGQNAKACDDVKLMFRLDNSLRSQPFIISHLVRMAILQVALQPVWQGCIEHQWTDQQLAEIGNELEKFDFLADYQFFMRGERAFAIQNFENQRITHEITAWDQNRGTNLTYRYHFMPAGYFYQNELNFARISQQWTLPMVDTNNRVVSPELYQRFVNADLAQLKHYSLYQVQALAAFRVVSAVATRIAFAQESADLARVGCALERYRLAHGEYPVSLDALGPQFIDAIPHDVINGKPLHYQRTSNGKFLLYSVGWNEKDDGGLIPASKTGGTMKNCDWVWPSTAK